jgi:hypothetical protein
LTLSGAVLVQDSPAAELGLEVKVANPFLLADQTNKTFLKVGLTGFSLSDHRVYQLAV